MKRILTIAVVFALAAGAAATPAHAIGIFASYWNLDKSNDDAWGLGVSQAKSVSPLISIHTSATWVKFSDAEVDMFPLEVAAVGNLGLFYGGIGGGYYIFSGGEADLDNNWGWFAVAGAKIALGGLGVFGELRWNELSTNIADTSFDVDLNGVGVNVGVILGGGK